MRKIALVGLLACIGIVLILVKSPATEAADVARQSAKSGDVSDTNESDLLELPPILDAALSRETGNGGQTSEGSPLPPGRAVFGSVSSSEVDIAATGVVVAWSSSANTDPDSIGRAIAGETVKGIWIGKVANDGAYIIAGLPEEGTIALAALAPSSFSNTKTLPLTAPAYSAQPSAASMASTEGGESIESQAVRQDLVLNAVFAAQFRVVDLETGGAPFCSPDFFHGPRRKSTIGSGGILTGVEGQPLLNYLAHQLPREEAESDPHRDFELLSSRTAESPALAISLTLPGYERRDFEVPSVPVAEATDQPMELGVRRTAIGWGTAVIQLDDGSSVAAAGLVGERKQALVKFNLDDGTHYGKSISLLGSPARLTLPAGIYQVSILSRDDIGKAGFELGAEFLEVPAGGEVELRASATRFGHVQVLADGLVDFSGDAEIWVRIESNRGTHGTRRISADAPFLFGMTEGIYKMAVWKMGGVKFNDQLVYSDKFVVQPGVISACLLPVP